MARIGVTGIMGALATAALVLVACGGEAAPAGDGGGEGATAADAAPDAPVDASGSDVSFLEAAPPAADAAGGDALEGGPSDASAEAAEPCFIDSGPVADGSIVPPPRPCDGGVGPPH